MRNKFLLSFVVTVLAVGVSGCTWTSVEKADNDVADVRIEAPVAASMNSAKIAIDASIDNGSQKVSQVVAEVPELSEVPVIKKYQEYLDGGYLQQGEYSYNGKSEQLTVLIDMRDAKVYAIRVTPMSIDPDHKKIQEKFAEDVGAVVTGMKMKDIANLKEVGGDNVCLMGLKDAVSKIMSRSKNSR